MLQQKRDLAVTAEIEQRKEMAQDNKQSLQTFNSLMEQMQFIQQDIHD